MSVPEADAKLQESPSISSHFPPLTAEEEDTIIHARITNDEKQLRRATKKFHAYTSVAYAPLVPLPPTAAAVSTVEDARDAFLVELASLHLLLKKAAMVCEAEGRQVEEYQRETRRIADDHHVLRGQITQLKTSLEDAQMLRRRKIEYDLVAEKVNTLPSREELEQSIESLENDMAAIRAEHENQNRMIQARKAALDVIVADLGSLRLMGKETDLSQPGTPGNDADGDGVDSTEDIRAIATGLEAKEETEDGEEDSKRESSSGEAPVSSNLNPTALPFKPRLSTPAVAASPALSQQRAEDDDIEMGEVSEEPKEVKGKKKVRDEELEEGEASDQSSELSDPPEE